MLSRPVMIFAVLGLGVLGYFTVFDPQPAAESDGGLAAAPRRAAAPATPAASAPTEASAPAEASAVANLFPSQSWAPPPPPPPPPSKPTPTPVPVAPPLPFVVTATWHERGMDQVVIEASGQQFILCQRCEALGRTQVGDTLMGSYRLDAVNRNMIELTYLPLNQKQMLPVGGTP
ncbi:hypothetical protein ACTSKR_05805 [Chitinibacteraceae bacterium HSL-7]